MRIAGLRRLASRVLACAGLLVAALPGGVRAQDAPPLPVGSMRENVVMAPKPGPGGVLLETTLFRPPGDGPFPLVIINHGKAAGDTHEQPRQRYVLAAREFVRRGYAVATPMRQGFARSGGAYAFTGCDVEANGIAQADDVAAALAALSRMPDIDARRVVVMGQSQGGLATIALGARNLPQVAGLVSFAGGLRLDDCPHWQRDLATAFAHYGAATTVPSVWFYGDNDAFFDADTWRRMFRAYTDVGGPARLVAFGEFGDNAHSMFASPAGVQIWLPELERFFAQLHLPFDVRYRLDSAQESPAMEDVAHVPFLGDKGRAGYRQFLAKPLPRAFAIAPDGAWAFRDGEATSARDALADCQQRTARGPCRLYVVDYDVVWRDDPAPATIRGAAP